MNPYAVRVELRPRTPFEVLDLASVLLRSSVPAMARVAAAVLPVFGVGAWLAGRVVDEAWLGCMALVLLSPLIQVPFLLLGARLLFDPAASARGVLHDLWSLRGAIGALVGGVLVLELLLGCSFFLLSPVLIPAMFVSEALLLERVDFSRAVARSTRLVNAAAGRALLGAVLLVILMMWSMVAGELSGQAIVRDVLQLGQPFGSLMEGQLTPYALAGLLVCQPLAALFRLLLYVDVRTVTEGWDLQVALRAAAEGR